MSDAIFSIAGLASLIAGASLYDYRAGLIVAGASILTLIVISRFR